MQTVNLRGLRVTLGEPVQVVEGIGHMWFPSLEKMPATGELLVSYILTADTNTNTVDGYGVSISRDGGQTWLPRYDVAGFGGGCMVRIPQPDGSLGGPNFYVYPDPPGDFRNFRGTFETFSHGGTKWSIEPWGTRVEGLPRDVAPFKPDGTQGRRWPVRMVFFGDAIAVDGGYVTSSHLVYANDNNHFSQVILRTDDLGRTWRYIGTVGGYDDVPPGPAPAKEGLSESSLCRLDNGDLMCVMRVGGGLDQPLARAYSADGGRTWSKLDRLPAYSVAPSTWRTQNGVIALSTGRPGIFLWLADDPRATNWQAVDILAHHNRWAPHAGHTINPDTSGIREQRHAKDQTTAYTELLELSPNRLLLVYDRVPFGWNPVPADADERNRIYVLPITVERT